MKENLFIFVIVAILGGGAFYFYQFRGETNQTNQEAVVPVDNSDRRMGAPLKQGALQAPERFTGKLQEVNIGCFADGECFVVVDGKHVTTTWGWTQEVVGTVKGVEGFGDLEQHIGKGIEVYANKLQNGDFTLYGDAAYYIELKK